MIARNEAVVVGTGGFARETLALQGDPFTTGKTWGFAGFLPTEEPAPQMLGGPSACWLGDNEAFLAAPSASHDVITNLVVPVALALRYYAAGLGSAPLIDPTVSITADVAIVAHLHIDLVVTIGHDSVVEDFVTLHPAGLSRAPSMSPPASGSEPTGMPSKISMSERGRS